MAREGERAQVVPILAAILVAVGSHAAAQDRVTSVVVAGAEDASYVERLARDLMREGHTPQAEEVLTEALSATGMYETIGLAFSDGTLRIDLREAPVIARVTFSCDGGSCPEGIESVVLPLRVGSRLRQGDGEAAVRLLQDRLRGEGYLRPAIDVEISSLGPARARVAVRATPGSPQRIVAIEVRPETEQAAMMQALAKVGLAPGAVRSESKVRAALAAWRNERERDGVIGVRGSWRAEEVEGGVRLALALHRGPRLSIQVDGHTVKEKERRLLMEDAPDTPEDTVEYVCRRLRDRWERHGYFEASVQGTLVDDVIALRTSRGARVRISSVSASLPAGQERLLADLRTQASGYSLRHGYRRVRPRQKNLDQDRTLLEALLRDEGYSEAKVGPAQVEIDGTLARVHFPVDAGRRTRVARVEVSDHGASEVGLALSAGKGLSATHMEEDEESLRQAWQNMGYAGAQVRAVVNETSAPAGATTGERWVVVRYEVDSGSRAEVAALVVKGAVLLQPDTVAERADLPAGTVLGRQALKQAEDRLRRIPLIASAHLRPLSPSTGAVPIVAEVRESARYRIRYAAGYNSDEGPRATFGFTDLAFWSGPRTASLLWRGGRKENRAEAALRWPDGLGWERPIVFTLFSGRDQREGFAFRKRGLLLDLTLHARESEGRRSDFSLRLVRKEIDLYDVTISETEIPHSERAASILSAGGSWMIDGRDDRISPTRGYRQKTSVELATPGMGASANYGRAEVEGFGYVPLGGRSVVAMAGKLGWGRPLGDASEIPISERFFLGGVQAMRAFARDDVGPRDAITGDPIGGEGCRYGSIELRLPLYRDIGAALFYERGAVAGSGSDVFSTHDVQDVGVGLRYLTPAGPLRIEYAWEVGGREGGRAGRDARWVLSLGEPF